jgi:hypothetical protein
MNEKHLTAKLMAALREILRGSVVLKHTDQFTSGVPDLSVTWGWATSWAEVKVVRRGRGILGRGAQTLTMQQLAAVGSAFYVVYHLDPAGTYVVHPGNIYGDYWRSPEAHVAAIDHRVVAEHVRALHLRLRVPASFVEAAP